MKYEPGDVITITVGDHKVETTIDANGVQRLPKNPVYSALFDSGALSLNQLAIAYAQKKISFEHYLDYYLNIGYSVCGFAELSNFQHLEIKNPVWDNK